MSTLKQPIADVGEVLLLDLTDHELALLAAQGFAKLLRDIKSEQTLLDLAAIRLNGISLPGWNRPRDEWEEAARRGYTDEYQS